MAADTLGQAQTCNFIRREDDTDDIVLRFGGGSIDVTGWSAQIDISDTKDGNPIATFTGSGVADGLIPLDMATFAVGVGSYRHDIRVTTSDPDSPSRVYATGSFKVVDRIKV